VAGRVVLIGNADLSGRNTADIPGHIDVPKSLVQIYAAETLKAGLTGHIAGYLILALCVIALCLALSRPLNRWADATLLALAAGLPVAVVAMSFLGIRVDVAPSLAFLTVYALLRARKNWRNRQNLIDPGTN